jgi:hypothetical protein
VGGPGFDFAGGISLDQSGNIYINGSTSGNAIFDSYTLTSLGSQDIFAAKLNPQTGNVLWAKRYGGSGYDVGSDLIMDNSGNCYMVGGFGGTIYLDSTMFSSYPSDTINLQPSANDEDIFVARISPSNGNVIWARHFGGNGWDYSDRIINDPAGNIFISGFFRGSATFDSYSLTPSPVYALDGLILKINTTPTGIEENQNFQNSILVKPNPFKDELTLFIDAAEAQHYNLLVIDALGKIVFEIHATNDQLIVPLLQLNSAIYYLKLIFEDGKRFTKKIIKD